jgi:hypothetical protein
MANWVVTENISTCPFGKFGRGRFIFQLPHGGESGSFHFISVHFLIAKMASCCVSNICHLGSIELRLPFWPDIATKKHTVWDVERWAGLFILLL